MLGRGESDFLSVVKHQLSEAEKRLATAKQRFETLLEETTEQLQSGSDEDRLAAIPGDAVINFIFDRFGLRFNKRKDGPKIADLMTPEEIAPEIHELLVEITTD